MIHFRHFLCRKMGKIIPETAENGEMGALYKFNINMSYQGVKVLHTIFRGLSSAAEFSFNIMLAK